MEKSTHPVPGIDYPRTFQEMDNWFRTEVGCRDYVRRQRDLNLPRHAFGSPFRNARSRPRRFRDRHRQKNTAAAITPAPVENEVGVEIVAPRHRGNRNPGRQRLRDNLPLEPHTPAATRAATALRHR
jgi:hypothetical protein